MTLDDLKALLQHESGMEPVSFRNGSTHVIASKTCSVTKEEYTVSVPLADYERWRNGTVAQKAFPYLSANEREFLISGNTPAEFDQLFEREDEA